MPRLILKHIILLFFIIVKYFYNICLVLTFFLSLLVPQEVGKDVSGCYLFGYFLHHIFPL